MRLLWFFLGGIAGGILAGMGMGGGTLTIPILTLGLHAPQIDAQAANLIAFIPTAVVALILHAKNGLIEPKPLAKLLPPAILGAAVTSAFAHALDADLLRRLFGGFLVVIALVCFCVTAFSARSKAQ